MIRTLPNPGKANYSPSEVRLFLGRVLAELFSVPCFTGEIRDLRRAISRDLARHARNLGEKCKSYPAEHVDVVVCEAVELIDGLRVTANALNQPATAVACAAILNHLRGPQQ